MAGPAFARLALAAVAATAAYATANLLWVAALLREPLLMVLSDRNSLASLAIVVVLGAVAVAPASLAIVVAIIFLTRYIARRGFASLGVMTLVGAALGLMPDLVGRLYEQLTFAQPQAFGEGLEGSTILFMLLGNAASGAVASAVYWRLLDPRSYYATDAHAPDQVAAGPVSRALRIITAVLGAAGAATGTLIAGAYVLHALSNPYMVLVTLFLFPPVFFPAVSTIIAVALIPFAQHAGRRGLAGVTYLTLCGTAIAGMPTLVYLTLHPATDLHTEQIDWWSITIATAAMALAGAVAGAVYALILRPNAYYRQP